MWGEVGAEVQLVLDQMNESGARGIPFFFAIDYELQEAVLWLRPDSTPSPIAGLCFQVGNHQAGETTALRRPSLTGHQPESYETYRHRFDTVYAGIARGDSFLANLTLRTPITLEGTLQDIYQHTRAAYRVLWPGRFVCFSPEPFVRINAGGTLSTFPMKGTIDAHTPNAAEVLLTDYKEGAEHYTIVDLMRNDLNRIGQHTRVKRFKYLDRLTTSRGEILQMSSEVVTELGQDWASRLGDLLRQLLPAGSISGAPKQKTCEIIQHAEGRPRGFYTGICGYFDGKALDSGVMIRYIEQEGTGYFYRSGGGITIDSQADKEYSECLQKIYLPLARGL